VLREIDILLRATSKGFLAIEKETHVSWGREELEEASRAGHFDEIDDVLPIGSSPDISSPFPACPQQLGAGASGYRLAAQTGHFFIFVPKPAAHPAGMDIHPATLRINPAAGASTADPRLKNWSP
jgi:hypothetical protein